MGRNDYWDAYQAERARLDRRNCGIGYSCGNACIPVKKECLKNSGSSIGKERLKKIAALAGGSAPEGKGVNRLRRGEAEELASEIQARRSARAAELRGQRGQRSQEPQAETESEKPTKGGALATRGGRLSKGEQEAEQGSQRPSGGGWESKYYGRDLDDAELKEFIDRKVKQMDDPEALRNDPEWRADYFRRAALGDPTVALSDWFEKGLISSEADLDSEKKMAGVGRQHAIYMRDTFAPKNGEFKAFGSESAATYEKQLEKLKASPKATPRKIKTLEDKLAAAQAYEQKAKANYERAMAELERDDPKELSGLGRRVVQNQINKAAEDDVNEFTSYLSDYGPKGAVYFAMRERLARVNGALSNTEETEDLPNAFDFFNMVNAGRERKKTRANADRVADEPLRLALKRLGGPTADYDLLGLKPGSEVTAAQLKSAYRRAAAKAHPDVGGSAEQFQAVNRAFNKLKRTLNLDSLHPYPMSQLFRRDSYARAYARTWQDLQRRSRQSA